MANSRKPTLNLLGLCSGVGMLEEAVGFALEYIGLDHRTVGLCEWEGYPAQQLIALMETGALAPAPVWCGDFADLDWKAFHGVVDAFVAGYPCQAWSTAGKRLGFADKRWVWGHIEHGLSIVRPRFVYLENVRGLISGGGLGATISGLQRLGYDTEWSTLYASTVGASHQRDRVFIFGYLADDNCKQSRRASQQQRASDAARRGTHVETQRTVADHTRIRRLAELAARKQSNAGVRGKSMVDANGKLHGAGDRHELQSRTAAHAGDQVEHRQRATRKPEGKASRKERAIANESVDWGEELLFAPGQNDSRWNQIISQRPDLAPTVKPTVHLLVDGLAKLVDQVNAYQGSNLRTGASAFAAENWRQMLRMRIAELCGEPITSTSRGLRTGISDSNSVQAMPHETSRAKAPLRRSKMPDMQTGISTDAQTTSEALRKLRLLEKIWGVEGKRAMENALQTGSMSILQRFIHEITKQDDVLLEKLCKSLGLGKEEERIMTSHYERQLRCAGNGVVPLQAAVAYIHLMRRAGVAP